MADQEEDPLLQQFDAIILGTGMIESILSEYFTSFFIFRSLSSAKKKVLHIDNVYCYYFNIKTA